MLQRYGSLTGKLHMIELEKVPASHGLGISLAGNQEASRARMSVYVASVDPQGPAGLDGRIQVGDELLEVKSENVDAHGLGERGALIRISGLMSGRAGNEEQWVVRTEVM